MKAMPKPNATGPIRTTDNLAVAIVLCLSAAFGLLGLPMTVYARHPVTLTLGYVGIAGGFCASMYYAVKGARSPVSAVMRSVAISIVAGLASYAHHSLWMTR